MRNPWQAIVVLAVSLAVSPPLLAQGTIPEGASALASPVPAAQHPEDAHPAAKAAVAKFLGLDESQLQAWDDLLETLRDTTLPLRAEQRSTTDELRALLDEAQPDPEQVGSLVIEERDLRARVEEAYRGYVQGFQQLLTADQATRLLFLRKAGQVQPLLPVFRLMGLMPPAPAQPPEE